MINKIKNPAKSRAVNDKANPVHKVGINRQTFLWILLISFIATAIYFQTVRFDFSADDDMYTYFNKATKEGLSSTGDLFKYGSMNFIEISPSNSGIYRPFTLLTFAAEHEIFKEFNPLYGHLLNIILYFMILLVAGLLLTELFNIKKIPSFVPLLILLIYAVHPVHTEVVASIKSRDTLLSALFSFSAVLLWLKYYHKRTISILVISALLFFLGLLSKEESLPFIAVVFLISYFFLKNNFLKSVKDAIPFIAAGALYLIIRGIVLDAGDPTYSTIINNVIFGARGEARIATNLYIYLYYIKLLFLPFPLSWDYSYNQIPIRSFSDGWVLFSLLFFIGLAYLAYAGFRKRTVTGFGILFYLSTFSIFANLTTKLTIGSTIGERFLFIPSLGFSILFVYGILQLIKRFRPARQQFLLYLIIIPVVLIFSVKSYSRTAVWKNNITLNQSGIITAPDSWRTHTLYADEMRQRAIEIIKKESGHQTALDSAYNMLKTAVLEYETGFKKSGNHAAVSIFRVGQGECMMYLGDTLQAKIILEKAVKEHPKNFVALFKLALIAFNEKNYLAAINYYTQCLDANSPDYFSTWKNLGACYLVLKDYEKSVKAYEKALEYGTSPDINTNLTFLYANSGNINAANGIKSTDSMVSNEEKQFNIWLNAGSEAYQKEKYPEAIQYFKKCYEGYQKYGGYARFPDFMNAFGNSYLHLNDTVHAKDAFLQVYLQDTKNYYALMNLGNIAFHSEKKYSQALQYFTQCLDANSPDYSLAYSNIGTLYLIQKQYDKSITAYENALNYGSSLTILNNLVLLYKSKGDQAKVEYYQEMLNKQ